jgi:tetratricopeptide (TPR) repeat protein
MRRPIAISCVVLSFLIAVAASAQIRGLGRLQGNIFDKSTGKPIGAATITISLASGKTQPIVAKSDSRGHWSALGLTDGQWNIDISAPGYATSRGSANVSEISATPTIRIEMQSEVKQEAAVGATAAPSIPSEAADAIKEGQTFLRINAGDVITSTQSASTPVSHTVTADEVKEDAKRAVADFEKALPMIGDDKPELVDIRNQVLNVLAQAYYKSGDLKNAIATFEKLETADPIRVTPDATHTTREVLLANLYLEDGQLDQGKALLDKLPATAISDPTAYTNIGILFLNKKNAIDAATYFTKAINLDPKRAETYYYRGLAELQMQNTKEARADFQQVLTLAPDSQEAKDSKQLLANLK